MCRLIAGLNIHMFPQGSGLREAVIYAEDAIKADGFQPPAPATATPGDAHAPVLTADEAADAAGAGRTEDAAGAAAAADAAGAGRTEDAAGAAAAADSAGDGRTRARRRRRYG
jgi:hypothetical protein